MARLTLALLVALTFVAPAFAADTPEARLRELVRRALDGTIGEIQSDVTPPEAFAARPLGEQVIMMTGTGALVTLVDFGDKSPLKPKVPAGSWPRVLAARATLDPVAKEMSRSLHATVMAALARKELLPARLHVGTANLYLRQMGEAGSLLEAAQAVAIARKAVDVVAQEDVQQAILALSVDLTASAEVRERAGHLYPLIGQTANAVRVAEVRIAQQLGL